MRYFFQYPDRRGTSGSLLDAGPVTDVARVAEAAGWYGLAFTEHPAPGVRWLEAGGHQSLDPFVALSFAAAVTRDLRLLTYLSVAPYRNPCLLAKTAATVDVLSGGRLVLGLGTGYLRSEFRALGVDFDQRNAALDETLDVLGPFWSGEPFDHEGRDFTCRGTIGLPRPAQQPIPVWLGGNATRTLRRVAERAQGWMPLVGPAELFPTVRSPAISGIDDLAARVAVLADLAGDRFDELEVVVAYNDASLVDPTHDVERHRDQLGRLTEIGATAVVVGWPAPDPGPSGTVDPAKTARLTLEFLEGFAAVHF